MPHRDDRFKPGLSDDDAIALAQEQWDAMLRRGGVSAGSIPVNTAQLIVRELADAYIASNRSTMRKMQSRD